MSKRREILDKLGNIGDFLPPVVLNRLARAVKASGARLDPREVAGRAVALAAMGGPIGLVAGGSVRIALVGGGDPGWVPVRVWTGPSGQGAPPLIRSRRASFCVSEMRQPSAGMALMCCGSRTMAV